MKGSNAVIQLLQLAVAGEALAEHQYIADAETLSRLGLPSLAEKMRAESTEERGHLTRYSRRLVFLETAPKIRAAEATIGHDSLAALLKNQLRLEMDAVKLYQRGVDTCVAEGDSVTRRIFEDTLADENDHVRFLEGQLDLVERMGEVNYIQAYVAIPEEG